MGGCGVATIARFQGGQLDGREYALLETEPVQGYIETKTEPCTCGSPECSYPPANVPPPQSYRRAGTGYRGETRIIIYRLEE
jgi:hypothetical protein